MLLVIRKAMKKEIPKHLKNRSSAFWLVRCDCGNELFKKGIRFMYQTARNCGCQRHGPSSLRLPHGVAAQRAAFLLTQQNVEKRGKIKWMLSFEQFIEISSHPCTYCGCISSKVMGDKKPNGLQLRNGAYRYNGIDRIDSEKEYTFYNCVACCKWCNYAKSDRSVADFKEWLKQAYMHFIKEDEYAEA